MDARDPARLWGQGRWRGGLAATERFVAAFKAPSFTPLRPRNLAPLNRSAGLGPTPGTANGRLSPPPQGPANGPGGPAAARPVGQAAAPGLRSGAGNGFAPSAAFPATPRRWDGHR